MDLGRRMAIDTYHACMENASAAAKSMCDVLLKGAAEEMTNNAEAGYEPSHLTVSGDGTWIRRGF